MWLMKRMTAARSRCTNPRDRGWKNYGGRGIRFNFTSVTEGARWVIENLGLDRMKDLDRKNNNGHYEAGNLRYSTRSQNNRNRRAPSIALDDAEWAATASPYSYYRTTAYLRQRIPKEAIIGLAYRAVIEKRKNWRGIKHRLNSLGYTTSSMLVPDTDSPCQTN